MLNPPPLYCPGCFSPEKGHPFACRACKAAARHEAHIAFDWLWKHGGLNRQHAYKILGGKMGLKKKDCHMTRMDWRTAKKAVKAAVEMREDLARARARAWCAALGTTGYPFRRKIRDLEMENQND